MFGIGKRCAQRRAHHRADRAAAAESTRLAALASELHRAKRAVRDAVASRRVNYVGAGVLSLLALVLLSSAVASAALAGWDFGARVPSGRHGTAALWAVIAWRAALGALGCAGAAALLVDAHRVIRKEKSRLARFLADHASDLPAIEPRENELIAADAAIDARVQRERTTPSLSPVTDVLGTASSEIRTQLRAAMTRIEGAKVRRITTFVLGPLLMAAGIFAISLGVIPANNAGWDLGTTTPAGRFYGVLPLWYVVAITIALGLVIFAGGVASLVGGFLAVRSANDWVVRVRFTHENELPTTRQHSTPDHVTAPVGDSQNDPS
jgi:hypothetical protein